MLVMHTHPPTLLQVMSGDSLPPELYAVVCAFNADLLSQSLGGRTLLVQRLVELVRVSGGCPTAK